MLPCGLRLGTCPQSDSAPVVLESLLHKGTWLMEQALDRVHDFFITSCDGCPRWQELHFGSKCSTHDFVEVMRHPSQAGSKNHTNVLQRLRSANPLIRDTRDQLADPWKLIALEQAV